MLVSVLSCSFEQTTNFLQAIKLRLTGETHSESPLHKLPELLVLLEAKNLNTHGIRFERNQWGCFDIEIQSEYPLVRENIIVVNMAKKIQRLLHYYYDETQRSLLNTFPYEQFVSRFMHYNAPYSSWKDSELYQLSSQWEQLDEAYAMLSPKTDSFYDALKQHNLTYKRPPMGNKHCRFDEAEFKQSQMILQQDAFGIVFNYRPQGDTRFHLMINSLQHDANLSTATSRHLFELEALFRTLYQTAERMQHGGERIMIYMQKHASMGMTMPHLHIHVLLTPTLEKFSHDILQEFRFLITSILHPKHNNSYAKPPLSDSVMQHRKKQLASKLSEGVKKQLTMQYQHFTLFSPPRKFLVEKNINAIIFDIGGVLNKGLPDFIQCFNDHGIILTEDLWANVECRQLIYNFCTGKYGVHENSARAFFEDIRRKAFVSENIPFEQFKQAWNAAIVSLNYELINQLHLLRTQGYRLFVLSDTNILHCEYGEELYQRQHPNKSFRAIFDKCYFSHETGNYKGVPDHGRGRAWLQILEENNLQPQECLFIDDKLEHVEKATALGLHGLHFDAGSTSSNVFKKLDEVQLSLLTPKMT